MHDVIVLGGGPAGYTAALYTARSGLRTLVIEKLLPGGQMTRTMHIENYPGIPEAIDGITLGMNMRAAAERFGAETAICEATQADIAGKAKRITTTGGIYEARALIIATGAAHRQLGVPGEKEFTGRGVSYCAACDGMLYQNRTVAVIGGGNSAAEEALTLSRTCKRVLLAHRRDRLRADAVYAERIARTANIEPCWNCQVTEFRGGDKLDGMALSFADGSEKYVEISGAFVSIGMEPQTDLFRDALPIESGYIVADETARTPVAGVFAAGDVRKKPLQQIITAAADGANAAYSAEKYIAGL